MQGRDGYLPGCQGAWCTSAEPGGRAGRPGDHGCCSGPPTLLAPEDYDYLVQYCIYCASYWFSFTRQRLMKYADKLCFGTQGRQSHHWGRGDGKCSGGGQAPWTGGAERAIRLTMDTFFTSYEKQLEESGLREKPRQIYNCDESGFCSGQSRHRCQSRYKGAKHVNPQAPGAKEHITVL